MRKRRTPRSGEMARLVGQDSDVVLELESGETVVGRGPLLKVEFALYDHCCLKSGRGVL
jgi:hypothetical protein